MCVVIESAGLQYSDYQAGCRVVVQERLGYSIRMHMRQLISPWVVTIIVLAGCSSQRIVPESLEPRVDRTVTFRDVLASPESYKGRVLVLGGEVLKAKRLRAGTEIEFLQLPLEDGEKPSHDRRQSQGRFLALQQEFLDPATVAEGTRVTMVGEVSGAKTHHLVELVVVVADSDSGSDRFLAMASAASRSCGMSESCLSRRENTPSYDCLQ